mmetsp:Transcript_19605/g.57050  ORF Transcript_19605/g.57050 Transcript_19605/m.57050 type:complete len:163 (-) Transcript_19605:182-670(-)
MCSFRVILILALSATKTRAFLHPSYDVSTRRVAKRSPLLATYAVTFPEKLKEVSTGIADATSYYIDESRAEQPLHPANKERLAVGKNGESMPTRATEHRVKPVDMVLFITIVFSNILFWTDPTVFSLVNLGSVACFLALDYIIGPLILPIFALPPERGHTGT